MARRRRTKRGAGRVLLPALLGGAVLCGGALAWVLLVSRQQRPSKPERKEIPVPTPPPPPAAPAPAVPTPERYGPPAGPWRLVLALDGTEVFQSGQVLTWFGDLSTDADGSPRAYHPDDLGKLEGRPPKGLDAPENAYDPARKKWVGVAVDKAGKPIVQGEQDPAPGYWVSTTSLVDARYKSGDPRRYVDSEQIPYLAVPPQIVKDLGVRVGDVAAVEYGDKVVFAIVADVGPRKKIGEGSIALKRGLGLPANPRGSRGPRVQTIRTYVFAGSGTKKPLSVAEIEALARPLYERLRDGRRVA